MALCPAFQIGIEQSCNGAGSHPPFRFDGQLPARQHRHPVIEIGFHRLQRGQELRGIGLMPLRCRFDIDRKRAHQFFDDMTAQIIVLCQRDAARGGEVTGLNLFHPDLGIALRLNEALRQSGNRAGSESQQCVGLIGRVALKIAAHMAVARRDRQRVVWMGEMIEADGDKALFLERGAHSRRLRQPLGGARQIGGGDQPPINEAVAFNTRGDSSKPKLESLVAALNLLKVPASDVIDIIKMLKHKRAQFSRLMPILAAI